MNDEIREILASMSMAYRAGMEAKKARIPLAKTAIRNLRLGSPEYDDFLAGYDSYTAPAKQPYNGADSA